MRKVIINEMKVKDGVVLTVKEESKNERIKKALWEDITSNKHNVEDNSSEYSVSGVGGYGLNII